MVFKQLEIGLRKLVCPLYQSWCQYRQRIRALVAEANQLVSTTHQADIPDTVQHIMASETFHPEQQLQEIIALLDTLAKNRPRLIGEIGCYRGGTLFLWCQVAASDANIISIDIEFAPPRIAAYQRFRRGKQKLSFISADSHSEEALDQFRRLLNGRQLDFLFIDGDHSYEGVKSDYEMYAPLVRPGGLIAFHDIVPDFETRYGKKTKSYTGGVPQFWQELKQQYPTTDEFIQDPEQDGFGIGLIELR